MTTFQLDWLDLLVLFLVNVGLPFLVDVVTKRFAATQIKEVIMLVLQLITGVVVGFGTAHSNHQFFDWPAALQAFIASVIFGVATVYKLHNLSLIGAEGLLAPVIPAGIGPVDPIKITAGRHEADAKGTTPPQPNELS